jgi:hypothetical protein
MAVWDDSDEFEAVDVVVDDDDKWSVANLASSELLLASAGDVIGIGVVGTSKEVTVAGTAEGTARLLLFSKQAVMVTFTWYVVQSAENIVEGISK